MKRALDWCVVIGFPVCLVTGWFLNSLWPFGTWWLFAFVVVKLWPLRTEGRP